MRRCELCGKRVWPWRGLTELSVTDGNGDPVMMSINRGKKCESAKLCDGCVKALLNMIVEEDEE